MAKIPPEAFDFYVSMGSARSYAAVAQEYGVTKRSVTKRAGKEGWQDRLADIEHRAAQHREVEVIESLQEMSMRHMRILRVIQAKALQSLKGTTSFDRAWKAIRALELTIRQERVVRGMTGESTGMPAPIVFNEEDANELVRLAEMAEPEPPRLLPAPTNGHRLPSPYSG